jgi:two-component system response regulator TctD
MQLLLIEDDPAMRSTLHRSLTRSGMQVETCGDGALALAVWETFQPDVVVLDLNLPGVDGLDVLRGARQAALDTPVLILTARGTVGDKVLGLNAGADDYLPKPFDLDELEARVRALYRRHSQRANTPDTVTLRVGPLRYEAAHGVMYLKNEIMDLPPRELALLRTLMATPGNAVAKERLFELVFPGEAQVQYEAIEVVAYRLRKKLQNTGAILMTLRGLGYLLKAQT